MPEQLEVDNFEICPSPLEGYTSTEHPSYTRTGEYVELWYVKF